MTNMLPHILGYIGVFCTVISYQIKTKKNIMIMQAVGRFFFILQYSLLFAFEGAALNVVCMYSAVIFMNRDGFAKENRVWLILMYLLNISLGIAFWKNMFSLFVLVGSILQNTAFAMKKPKMVRICTFACLPLWLIYNAANGAIAAIICDILSMISTITGIIRIDVLKQVEKENI